MSGHLPKKLEVLGRSQGAVVKGDTALKRSNQRGRKKCPYYRGVSFREINFIWISVPQGPSELSVIDRCL